MTYLDGLSIEQRVRICVLQELLDHTDDIAVAVDLAPRAAAWVLLGDAAVAGETSTVSLVGMLRAAEPERAEGAEAPSAGCGADEAAGGGTSTVQADDTPPAAPQPSPPTNTRGAAIDAAPSREPEAIPTDSGQRLRQPAKHLGEFFQGGSKLGQIDAGIGGNAGVSGGVEADEFSPQPLGGLQPKTVDQADVERRADDACIRQLAARGWSYAAIATEIGKTDGYVRSRAQELGLPLRKPGPAAGEATLPTPAATIPDKRARFARLWMARVDPSEIARELGYRNAASVITSASKWGLPSRRSIADDQAAVERHLAEKGVSTAPDFGDAEINAIWQPLKDRGYSLVRLSRPDGAGPWIYSLNGGGGLKRADLLERAKRIIATEKPLPGREAAE